MGGFECENFSNAYHVAKIQFLLFLLELKWSTVYLKEKKLQE